MKQWIRTFFFFYLFSFLERERTNGEGWTEGEKERDNPKETSCPIEPNTGLDFKTEIMT